MVVDEFEASLACNDDDEDDDEDNEEGNEGAQSDDEDCRSSGGCC